MLDSLLQRVGGDIALAASDWKILRITVNHSEKTQTEVTPSVSAQETERDRKKQVDIKHDGSITFLMLSTLPNRCGSNL